MNISIYDPRTMGAVIERMPPVKTFFKSTLFKKVRTFPTKSIDIDFRKGNRQIAPFVHPKKGGKIIENRGYETKTYTPPLIAPNKVTTIDDILNRSFGETLYSSKTPAERAIEKMVEDFRELAETITRREELMCAQTIFTGKIPIIGDGINEEIDFNFTNFDKKTVAAPKWQKDKIGYLKSLRKEVQKKGYVNCDICLMADDVLEDFLKDEAVMNMLDTKAYDIAVIKPQELPNGMTYVGTIHGENLVIYTYNEWYLDDWTDKEKPTTKPLVPDGHLALLSSASEFSMNYAAVTYINEAGIWVTAESDRVPQHWVAHNPDREFLALNSKPLPIAHEVDSWYVAEVL